MESWLCVEWWCSECGISLGSGCLLPGRTDSECTQAGLWIPSWGRVVHHKGNL